MVLPDGADAGLVEVHVGFSEREVVGEDRLGGSAAGGKVEGWGAGCGRGVEFQG